MLLWLGLLRRAWVPMLHTGTMDAAGCGPLSLCQARLLMSFAKGAAAQNGTWGLPCAPFPAHRVISTAQEMGLLPSPTPGSLPYWGGPHFQAMGEHRFKP